MKKNYFLIVIFFIYINCNKYEYDIINQPIISPSIVDPPLPSDPSTPVDPPEAQIIKCENEWCKVETGVFKGWVDNKNLWGYIK